MKNEKLIQEFVQGAKSGKGSNLEVRGNLLINYSTIIARRKGEKVYLNVTHYSQTTTRIQTYVRRNVPKNLLVEMNAADIVNPAI